MTTKKNSNRTNSIHVRLDDVEYENLKGAAKAANTEMATLLRSYMYECLSGFDRQHEELLASLRKIQLMEEKLNARLELVAHMSAAVAGGLASLPGKRLGDPEALEARANVLQAFGLAEALLKVQGDLLAKKKG